MKRYKFIDNKIKDISMTEEREFLIIKSLDLCLQSLSKYASESEYEEDGYVFENQIQDAILVHKLKQGKKLSDIELNRLCYAIQIYYEIEMLQKKDKRNEKDRFY